MSGTSWFTKDDLEKYLNQQEEAEKRDHRKLGNEMNLFTTAEELGSVIFFGNLKEQFLEI